MTLKWPWFARIFRRAIAGHLASGLDGIYVRGWREAREALAGRSFVLAPTHVAYWDTLLLLFVEDLLDVDGYALMDQANYDRLPFFAWLGAVPVDLERPRSGLQTSVALLSEPGRMVVVFPQGRQRPAHLRPLDLKAGVAMIARRADVVVQPMALTYVFHESPKPTVYLDFPTAMDVGDDPRGFLSRLEDALVDGLDRIDHMTEHNDGTFDALVPRAPLVRPGLGMRLLGWAAQWGARRAS